jgi:hypothetical protein
MRNNLHLRKDQLLQWKLIEDKMQCAIKILRGVYWIEISKDFKRHFYDNFHG